MARRLIAVLALSVACAFAPLGEIEAANRIVSLYAGHSENILALGFGKNLVAVSEGDDEALFPGIVRLPRRADAERILSLVPDLVLLRPVADGLSEGTVATLERSGVSVVLLPAPTWDTMETYLRKLGELLGAMEAERSWRDSVKELASPVPSGNRRPAVFLESSSKGLKTCSPTSWAAHMIELAGGRNAAADARPLRADSPLASWGEERLLALAAEGLDVYLVQVGAMNPVNEEEVRSRPWVSALGNARIAVIGEEEISRPSLLRLRSGVARLRSLFFPKEGDRR
jgi:iron complex transport system substrate-binding protein